MVYRILVGSYTSKVFTLAFDPAVPSLRVIASLEVGHHPSWLTAHPDDPSLIFTGLEQTDGRIIALRADEEGGLKAVGDISSGGRDPASLVALKEELVVGNYSSGNIFVTPISTIEPHLPSKPSQTHAISGTGPNAGRQEASHPHQVVYIPEHDELLVPDLGSDRTWRFIREDGQWSLAGYVEYEPGSGPRHAVFLDGILYTLCELTSSVATHKLPALPSPPTLLSTTSSMQNPPSPLGDMLAAEIILSPPILNVPRHLYVSNRNAPSPQGDPLAIFSLANPDRPTLVREVRTGLKHVRGVVLRPRDGGEKSWVAAGGALGGGVKVYEVGDGGDTLTEVAQCLLDAPTDFLWL
ncbi:3-carboxy-cis,cis-mucoante lactonizing enzyme [Amylostereum chailletii]|nr:3-carboxy-cis,cis-mucoante lactonizing enzyme [Amylostereum chailletii]